MAVRARDPAFVFYLKWQAPDRARTPGHSNKISTTVGIKCLLIVVKERIPLLIHGDPRMSDQHPCTVSADRMDSDSLCIDVVSISPRLRRSKVIESHSKPSWSPSPVLAQQAF
jgi:hypothetical protein